MTAPTRMSKDEQIHAAKVAAAFVIGFSAFAIASPVISFQFPDNWALIPYFVWVGLMYCQMLGSAALLGISNRPTLSRDIALGAVSAVLMLAVAPESIRVALIKMPISLRWIVMSPLATVAVSVYILLAIRYWIGRRAVT
jgi:hypothetical protein